MKLRSPSRSPTAAWAASSSSPRRRSSRPRWLREFPVVQPEKIRVNAEFRAQLEAIAPDAIIVVAYGRLIPPWMLSAAPAGLHQSARLAAAQVSRRRADSVGAGARRGHYRQHDDAAGRGPGHGADPAAAGLRHCAGDDRGGAVRGTGYRRRAIGGRKRWPA